MFKMYDVPELKQPNNNKLAKLYSKLNSSVKPFILHKNTPTQNPMHIGQWNNSPNPLKESFGGLILLNIEP